MGKCYISVLILLFSCTIIVQCQTIRNQELIDELVNKSIPLILETVRDSVHDMDYASIAILNTEIEGNNLTVAASINVTCKGSSHCIDSPVHCTSFLGVLPNGELEFYSSECMPNAPFIEKPLALPLQGQLCAGCLGDINTDAEGVDALAKTIIQHVQYDRKRRYILLEVLKVQQQVVNGVNFILTVKIAPAICQEELGCVRDQEEEDIYCLVKFFQKPGYEKPKHIISNNCTNSQTFDRSRAEQDSNEINKVGPYSDKNSVHVKYSPVKKEERSENDILADLMSQIIPYDQSESSQKKDVEIVQSNPVRSVESSSVHNLVDEDGQPMISSSTFQEVLATEDEPISLGTDTAEEQDVTPINLLPSSHASPSVDVISNPRQNQYSSNQQNENVEVTSQNSGSEHGNSISAPVGKYESDLLEDQPLRRIRRSVVNSEKFSPSEKTAIENIADFVASTLDTIDDDNHKRIVLQIINVKKIRTDALFLNMNLRIGVSKCGENDHGVHCKEDLLGELTKFCKVQVLINEDFENPKVVKSHCDNEKQDPQKANRTSNIRGKRALLGGKDKTNVNDPKIKQYVSEAVNYMNTKLSRGETPIQVNRVLSATSQVVSGMSYDIKIEMSSCDKNENSVDNCAGAPKICNINVWYRPWLNSRVITIDCGGPKLTFNALDVNIRKNRSVPGGWSPGPIDNTRVLPLLGRLLQKMDTQSDKNLKLKIKSIISVSSQVVAGTNWDIKAKVAFSDCLKLDGRDSKDCGESADPFETACDFKFWEKLPDKSGFRELENIQVNCFESKLNYKQAEHSRKRRSLVGGHNAIGNDDPRILKHLNKLLPQLDSQSGKEHKLKIKSVLSTTTQVVAGTNWNIRAKVSLSDCLKIDEKEVVNCGENKQDFFETTCSFKFWEKLPDKNGVRKLENVQIECDEPKLNFRDKRGIHSRKARTVLVGGYNAVANDDPSIGKHLNILLPQLDSQSGKEQKLRIKEIISAESQVVAGTNWNIRAKIALSDCPNTGKQEEQTCGENKQNSFETICTFKFWERLPDKNGARNLENVQIVCSEPKLNFRSRREIHTRKRRQVLVGGYNAVANDDPSIGKHLNILLPRLDSQSGKEHKLKIKEILSATSQVVAGTNWHIKAKITLSDCSKSKEKISENCEESKSPFVTVCDFKFWERLPDKNGVGTLENVQIDCDEPKLNYRSKRAVHSRDRREVLAGGHNTVPNDDPRIENHLNILLPQLDSQSDKEYKLKFKKILSTTTQVVAGTNWNIKVEVGLSDCLKSDTKKNSECGDSQNSFSTLCEFKFWEKLPDKNGVRALENIEMTCDYPELNFRSKSEVHSDFEYQPHLKSTSKKERLLGEEYEVDKKDPMIYEYLSKSLQQIDLNSPEENKFKVKEVIFATKQVVEGDLWKIKVRLVLSDCTKNDVTDWDQCGDLEGAEPKTCVIKIWDRPWIKQGRETHIACENQKKVYTFRTKRSSQLKRDFSKDGDYDIHFAAFEEFEQKYNKSYSSSKERMYRFSVFRENMWYVKWLNEHEQGTATYGLTQFADMSRKEFSKRLGYRTDLKSGNEIDFPQAEIPDIELPISFDWRDKNAVAEVKNQGSCGSCWAFSVTGNIEGQYAIKNGQLLEFSEQELVDCDNVDEGCNGGLMDNAYRQIEKLGGLEQEKDYPYDGRNEKCHFNKSLALAQLSGAVNISSNETDMAKWLLKNGPISIAINANAMQFYVGGVSHPWKFLCNPKNLDHGVLIVGYGVHTYPKFKKTLPYWIVKNSWGTSWGEQGYYRVYRGDGTCGVNQTPSSAILK